jgi:hypothetical protein
LSLNERPDQSCHCLEYRKKTDHSLDSLADVIDNALGELPSRDVSCKFVSLKLYKKVKLVYIQAIRGVFMKVTRVMEQPRFLAGLPDGLFSNQKSQFG